MRRSQMSILLLLGIIVIIVFGALIWLSSVNLPKDEAGADWAAESLYMQECMDIEADSILKELGITGGRLEKEILFTSYLIRGGADRLPGLEKIALDIAMHLNRSLEQCAASYPQMSVLKKGTPEFSVLFGLRQTIITISRPYTVQASGGMHMPTSMTIARDVRFRTMHEAVSRIIADRLSTGYTMESPGLSVEGHVIEVLDLGMEELWAITDMDSYISNEPYKFIFAFSVEG